MPAKPNGGPLKRYEEAAVDAIGEGLVPGAVALVANRDRVLHQSALGPSHRSDGQPHALDDVFMIASMTKAISSVAGAQLLEQGRFTLDQPAEEILPELASHQVITGFDADGKPILRPAKRKMTMRHLFTHTSGHSSDVWNINTKTYAEVMGLCLDYMKDDPSRIADGMRICNCAKYLERIADHATNIAEMVVFMVDGHDVRHGHGQSFDQG